MAGLDQPLRVALVGEQAAPDLGNQQADVVVHPEARADVAGRGAEARVAGEQHGDQRVVEIRGRGERVERPFRERALRARARRAGRRSRERAHVVHEQLGQLLVVDGPVHAERADAFRRPVVPPAREHADHREQHRRVQRQPAVESRAHLRDVAIARARQVRPNLQVARVPGRLAVDQPRLGRADRVPAVGPRGVPGHVRAHRRREGIVQRHLLDDAPRVSRGERLEVRAEEPGPRHVLLGLAVEAGMDGVVGALEQPELAVLRQLEAGMPVVLAREADEPARRHHHRGGDVVLHLDLVGGDEVLPQLVRPPGAVLLAADPEVVGDEPAALVLELVPGRAVDDVDAEMAAPIGAPLRPVEALDDEDQGPHVVGNALEPGVVLRRELGGAGREQLDHRAERAFGDSERRARRSRALATIAWTSAMSSSKLRT